ncbi:class II glutamine amidotransferase, partial [Vibrio parahaemolyticus]
SLPEHLYIRRIGTTDSELIFLLMLKNGLERDPVAAIRQTIAEIEALMVVKSVVLPFKASICLSDGQQFWLIRYSTDGQPPTVYRKPWQDGIILASEPLDACPNWLLVEPQTITHVLGAECQSYLI